MGLYGVGVLPNRYDKRIEELTRLGYWQERDRNDGIGNQSYKEREMNT